MSEEEIRFKVYEIIAENMGVDRSAFEDGTAIVQTLGADSLDTVEMIMEAEDEFEIDIKDKEAESIITVGDAIALVKRKVLVA